MNKAPFERVDGDAGAKWRGSPFLAVLRLGLRAAGASQPAIRQPKRVQHVAATARPPDPVALGTRRQAEPALRDRLAIDDFRLSRSMSDSS